MAADWQLGDVTQVAKYLGLTKDTIYRKVKQGKIPHHWVGARLRFRRIEIEEWIDSSKVDDKKEKDDGFVW